LAENRYDLKKTLHLIATSAAYQSQSQVVTKETDADYVFAGPRAKRLTAEQFLDSVWQLTGAAPTRIDAPVLRGKSSDDDASREPIAAKWIWNAANSRQSPAGEVVVFRKQFDLTESPQHAAAVLSCDNSYVLYVNGQRVQAGDNWQVPDATVLTQRLKRGANEVLIVATNGGQTPNAAALFCEIRLTEADGQRASMGTDETWQWTAKRPNANGRYARPPDDWQPAVAVSEPEVWAKRLRGTLANLLARANDQSELMVRAALVKSDFLMRSLGRPNRDQIVSVRPSELTTLEAIDLSNGQTLADTLATGAKNVLARQWQSPEQLVGWLFQFAVSREPTPQELQVLIEVIGTEPTEQGVEDALWSVIMLPEFQLVR
jgi:hypothetical protein